jgi:hypothetical protein
VLPNKLAFVVVALVVVAKPKDGSPLAELEVVAGVVPNNTLLLELVVWPNALIEVVGTVDDEPNTGGTEGVLNDVLDHAGAGDPNKPKPDEDGADANVEFVLDKPNPLDNTGDTGELLNAPTVCCCFWTMLPLLPAR